MRRLVTSIVVGFGLAATVSAEPAPPSATVVELTRIYAITYRAGPGWKAGVPMERQGLREHYFYWKALDAAGRVALAGPMGPEGGLILLHARDQADADRVIADDPANRNGVFVGEARRFIPRFVGKAPLTPVNP